MNIYETSLTEQDLYDFFQNMYNYCRKFKGSNIEFRSKKYTSLRILDHKGYIYLIENDDSELVSYEKYKVDGFRCMEETSPSDTKIYFEIHAGGGDTFVTNPSSFKFPLPINVINFLLDSFKSDFISKDVYYTG